MRPRTHRHARWRVPAALLAAFCVFVPSAIPAAEGTPPKGPWRLAIYWTDVAPTLDGLMEEDCWKPAEVVDDFRVFQKAAQAASLGFGRGALQFTFEGAVEDITARYEIARNGKAPVQKTLAVDKTLSVPFHITHGGRWTAKVAMRREGRPFYTAAAACTLPPVRELLNAVRRNLEAAGKRIAGFQHPAAGALKRKLADLTGAAAGPLAAIAEPDRLTPAQWDALVRDTEKLDALWGQLKYDLHLITRYPQDGGQHAFAVGQAGPTDKVYRNGLFDGELDGAVALAQAGGETESFQLVVIPFWRGLEHVAVTFSDLVGEKGRVADGNVRWFTVDYVRMNRADPMDPDAKPYEPDILQPGAPFSVADGSVESVWVDVRLPEGTPAGEYRGTIRIEADGSAVEKALRVHAFGFDLPKKASLENNFWFAPGVKWSRFYGSYGNLDYPPELYEKHARVLSRYRITCYADDWMTMRRKVMITRGKDGTYTFDFAELGELIEIGKRYGSTAYRASHGCNLSALIPFYNNLRVSFTDKKAGKPYIHQLEEARAWRGRFREGKAYYDEHPVYSAYLPAYVKFLKRVGLLETAYWEIYDEPNSNPRWLDMIRHHTWLKEYVPELKLTFFGANPSRSQAGKDAVGLVDVWAPMLPYATAEEVTRMHERRRKHGEKFWFYTCSERRGPGGGRSPFIYYHRSYLGARIHAWMAWKLKADGFLIFAMTGVPKSNIVKDPAKRWPNTEWLADGSRGCGTLVYPGPDYELIPGIRLACIRDGLEDYEYFHVLRGRWRSVDQKRQAELYGEIERELRIEPEIITDPFTWTRQREPLESKRKRLAALILKAGAAPRR